MALASKVPPSFTKALEFNKSLGFSHIKVELEARLGRGQNRDERCVDCHADGWLRCGACNHSGFTVIDNVPMECGECNGDGSTECRRCNGRGFLRGGYSDSWCRDFIIKHISRETADLIVYSEFYWDGSVDSEFTFTIPMLAAHRVIEVIEAFNKLAEKIGNGLSIDNAGLHIGVLPSGTYPCSKGLLNSTFMENFRRETAKLLPALYFLGTHTNMTRDLGFRRPFVSSIEKYSAIYTHGDTAIEYRLFDPCFDKPTAFFDKVEIIAATLKYYSTKKVKASYEKFNMFSLQELSSLYGTMENYDALLKTVKEVKPSKTFTALKNERKFKITKSKLVAEARKLQIKFESKAEDNYTKQLARWQRTVEENTQWVMEHLFNSDSYSALSLRRWADKHGITSDNLTSEAATNLVIANGPVFGISRKAPQRETFNEWLSAHTPRPAYVLTPDTTLDEEAESQDYDEPEEEYYDDEE
jgi:hypothetical protein